MTIRPGESNKRTLQMPDDSLSYRLGGWQSCARTTLVWIPLALPGRPRKGPNRQECVSFHFVSFHFVSFHFVSFHFVSFRFISFHFTAAFSLQGGVWQK
jgi:hypothetical protein